jgi:dTDP-4-dehydrorhamnose reductase
MRIILTGASGLIGSRFEELLFEKHEIIPLSSTNGVDITNKESIENFLQDKDADVVVHLAAKTDVDGCEIDKPEDLSMLDTLDDQVMQVKIDEIEQDVWKGKSSAFAINSIGTKNLYDVAQARGWKFVYISTDFVFSGKEDSYTEESETSPVDWYGMTKWFGEKVVVKENDLIVRLSFPYGYRSPVKKDVVWKLHDFIEQKEEVSLISDQVITPTFIDDIVYGVEFLLQKNVAGIFHLTGSSSLSPFDIGTKIKNVFGFSTTINTSHLAYV